MCIGGAATVSAAAAASILAREARPLPKFAGCFANRLQVRPRSILVACGDGNFFLTGLSWSHWNARRADGAGTGHQNDCTPDCARGHFHLYRVAVRLFRPVTCKNGQREFTRFSWSFVGNKPARVLRTGTVKSPFYLGSGCP